MSLREDTLAALEAMEAFALAALAALAAALALALDLRGGGGGGRRAHPRAVGLTRHAKSCVPRAAWEC